VLRPYNQWDYNLTIRVPFYVSDGRHATRFGVGQANDGTTFIIPHGRRDGTDPIPILRLTNVVMRDIAFGALGPTPGIDDTRRGPVEKR